jgi:hypothetical protein
LTPPTRPSLKVVKSFAYRGGTRQWSNRYFFNGGTPADSAHWTTLSDSAVSHETNCYGPEVTIVSCVGYDAGSDVPVFSKAYSTVGTGSFSTSSPMPGDVVALIKSTTDARTSKNHPIYLYKYYHDAYRQNATTSDTADTTQLAHLKSVCDNWRVGLSDGTNTLTLCGPRGASALSCIAEPLLTHRDFPR